MMKDAILSDDGIYRYWLTRRWAIGPAVCFIMLNPSTADAEVDDPTIRRCIHFARANGYGALHVVNLFAFRATDPHELRLLNLDVVGPGNDDAIVGTLYISADVVCAWGAHGRYMSRDEAVLGLIHASGKTPLALKVNKDGTPAHPLYLPNSSALQEFV